MAAAPAQTVHPRLPLAFLVALGFIQAVWPLTMDLYLPAFPRIGEELGASPALVQATLTGAFVGMAIGQLAAGPLSDAVGRMRPLGVALAVYIVATLVCTLAPTIEVLIGGRVLQGIASSACAVVTLAIVRDSASGSRMLLLLARLQLVNGVFVVGSPALGAQLLQLFESTGTGWRGLFGVLVGYGTLLLVGSAVVLLRRETNPRERRIERAGATVLDDYRALARDRRFLGTAAVGALLFAGMMSYMASSAFLFQDVFGLSATGYAVLFGGHGALMIAGAQVSGRLSGRVSVVRMLRIGAVTTAVASLALVASTTLFPQWGLLGFVVPLFLFTAGFGFTAPTIQSLALGPHRLRAGTAASWLGAANMVFGALASPLVGLFGEGSAVVPAVIMAGCTVTAVVTVLVVHRATAT